MQFFRVLTVVETGKSGNETGGHDGEMTLTVTMSFCLLSDFSVMVIIWSSNLSSHLRIDGRFTCCANTLKRVVVLK